MLGAGLQGRLEASMLGSLVAKKEAEGDSVVGPEHTRAHAGSSPAQACRALFGRDQEGHRLWGGGMPGLQWSKVVGELETQTHQLSEGVCRGEWTGDKAVSGSLHLGRQEREGVSHRGNGPSEK